MTTATDAGPLVVDDLAEDEYHADEALSSSGARKLLPPSCPARYRYERDHPVHKDVFDFGTAAHALVLGKGRPLAWLEADSWRTTAAKEWKEAARAEGSVPLLKADYEHVQAMAEAIRAHSLASALLCRDDVAAEQSLFWTDAEHGIRRRARLDAVRGGDGRVLIPDYKTTDCAEPGRFAKSVVNFGYHQQAIWYLTAAAECYGAQDAAFLFVAQEKTPPYLVSVTQPDEDMLRAGALLNRKAIEVYRDCMATGLWPGYQPDGEISLLSLPAWARPREDYL